MSELAPTQRFSPRADFYVRGRPGYPPALLEVFRRLAHLTPADPVADIASGTGALTQLLVHNGNPTFAVEPNLEMRTAAERLLAGFLNFHSVDGTAEATTLPAASVRLITVAQALHWLDVAAAAVEFRRILQPGGFVAVIWNERDKQSPVVQAYDALNEKYVSRATRQAVAFRAEEPARLRELFGSDRYHREQVDNPHVLDRAGLLDRITSASYIPLPGTPAYPQIEQDSNALFDRFQINGTVALPQRTILYLGQLQ